MRRGTRVLGRVCKLTVDPRHSSIRLFRKAASELLCKHALVAAACATVLGSVIVFHPWSAQGKEPPPPPPVYNPYPPSILPDDLKSEIERVRREVRDIEEEAL